MSNKSLVYELQQLATNNTHSITNLLRKALLVAVKLKQSEFEVWIKNELNGYEGKDVPKYRQVQTKLKVVNPVRGYIPFIIDNPKFMETIQNVPLSSPIGSLEDLLNRDKDNKGEWTVPFTPQQTKTLMDMQQGFGVLEPVRTIGLNSIANILESVKSVILEWSLKLETEGIIGEDLSFSNSEKEKAVGNQQIKIENFQGIIGDVKNSTVTQNLDQKIIKGDFDSLNKYLKSLGVEDEDILGLKTALEEEPILEKNNNFGKKVSNWIGKISGKAAQGLLKIGIGTAGNLLANAIQTYYGF